MKSPVERTSLYSKFFCYVDLETSPLRQILLYFQNNSLMD